MKLTNFKKYYTQLVSALVEKLSDSKVIIRQSVLKCCTLIITVNLIQSNILELQSKHFCFSCNALFIAQ